MRRRPKSRKRRPVFLLAWLASAVVAAAVVAAADEAGTSPRDLARQILSETGTRGGMVVHLGCGDGRLTAALGAGTGCLVHGLDAYADNVAAARKQIRRLGRYGEVSVDRFDGSHLPYADNLVNLLVVSSPESVDRKEILRVLAPGGAAITVPPDNGPGTADKLVNPWPEEIDEWTHYLHGADGNAVADDVRAGVPRHAQWIASPLWPRSHEYTPSISALTSCGGRIFYIMDDGMRGLFDERFPERWAVYARDAFSGVLLWKRPLPNWGPDEWTASGHWSCPMSLPRRLVSSGDRVYVTLGYRASVSALDAATGKTVASYDQTKHCDEIIVEEAVLLARCRREVPHYPPKATAWDVTVRRGKADGASPLAPASLGDERLVAVDTKSGKTLWEKPEKRLVTLSLAAGNGKVCYHTLEQLVCLELATGRELWREESKAWPDLTGTGVTLVIYDDLVLTTSSEGLVARSIDTGEPLWRGPRIPRVAPRQPADLLVADGLVWTSLTPEMPMGTVPKQPALDARVTGKDVLGLDPRTGELRRTIEIHQLMSVGHHVRCYRSKATQKHLLWPKRGIEFVDIAGRGGHMRCDWTRGECSYGVMPANGLLYVPPHPCVCYTGVALNGFNAFAAARSKPEPKPSDRRLKKGPAYGEAAAPGDDDTRRPTDWPMYRHDASRSGCTESAVPPDAGPLWTAPIGGRLTQPVVAQGRLLVASVDEHTIHCLDEEGGRPCWTFTAGARIDSPPAIHHGLVLFGCRDGWVYCLRASDGALAWRFRAAPEDRRIVAFDQVESAWGVHGSVLPTGGAVYFAAGRSSFLDGGIHLYALDAATGKLLHQAQLDGPWPDVRNDQGQPYHMEGAKTDVLVSDGTHLHMFHNKFDRRLRPVETKPRGAGGDRLTGLYLTATSGLLDDTLHDRFYWFHNRLWPGSHFACQGPKSGHIMVFDEKTTYGQRAFSRRVRLSPKFTPGREGYFLFADHRDTEALVPGRSARGTEYRPSQPPKWSAHVPVRALAMVLAGDILFLAGPPDEVPPEDPYAALEGRRGAKLWAVSAESGARLGEYELDSPPVFDGMSAADGRLYIATQAGEVLCMGARR